MERLISLVRFLFLLSLALVSGAAQAGTIIGFVDKVSSSVVSGWACDSGVNASVDVHMYAAGPSGSYVFVASAKADASNEAEVNKKCGTSGVMHRYNIPLTPALLAKFGGQRVYVHGISRTKGANFSVARSGELRFPEAIVKGYLDRVDLLTQGVLVRGWACQYGVPQTIQVHLYAGGQAGAGTFVASAPANQDNEEAVNNACGTTGTKHRYSFLLSRQEAVKFSGQKLYVHGIRQIGEANNSLLVYSGAHTMPAAVPFQLSELAKNGSDLTIPAGAHVQIDKSIDIGVLTIAGRLSCPNAGEFTLKTAGINITGPGAIFECGTPASRFAGNLRIALKPGVPIMNTERTVMVMNGGTLRLTGQNRNAHWLRLAKTAEPGDQEITLPQAVAWSVGDQVVLGPSSYEAKEAEQLTVESLQNDGRTVRFTTPLKFRHWGELQTFAGSRNWVVDERAEVANLTRNIVIYADGEEAAMDYRGGHVMVMRGSYGFVDGVEFFRMGRMGEMARYPFHWHRVGDVAGQYIVNSSIHRSFQRCVTVHGTNRALVKNNVCYDHFGHGFFLEDGDETENRIVGNLGILSRRPLPGRHLLQSDINTANGDRFPGPATYWISNPKNDVAGNVASGSEGTGFWMSFSNALYCEPRFCQLPDAAHPATVRPATEATLRFDNNRAHSMRVGMTWDGVAEGALTNNPNNASDRELTTVHYAPPVVSTFRNLMITKTRDAAIYVRANTLQFDNFILADNRVGLFFAYNQVVMNSLVMALSRNHREADFAYNQEFTGVRLYDGPFDLRNIDFVNFPSQPLVYNGNEIRPTPFMMYGGANRFTHGVQGLRFFPEPSRRVDFSLAQSPSIGWADANNSPSLRDFDGSLAGKANTILVPEDRFNDDSSCVRVPGAGAFRCEYQMGVFIFLSIRNNQPWEQTPFVVKRSDGPTTHSFEELKQYIWNLKHGVILGGRYEYELTFAPDWVTPGKQSGGAWWPNSFQIIFQSEAMGQESPVMSYKNLGQNCMILGSTPMPSLAALRSAHGNAYFNAGPTLYAKFVATKPVSQAGSDFAKSATHQGMVQCSQ